jgi:hypothetical protein
VAGYEGGLGDPLRHRGGPHQGGGGGVDPSHHLKEGGVLRSRRSRSIPLFKDKQLHETIFMLHVRNTLSQKYAFKSDTQFERHKPSKF